MEKGKESNAACIRAGNGAGNLHVICIYHKI